MQLDLCKADLGKGIDCLCVIQDSVDDWRRFIASMSDLYSNTYCTIAATKSIDPTEGLFVKRNPFHYLRYAFLMELKTTRGSSLPYFLE